MMIWGSAIVGLISGYWTLAAKPKIADKKPIGKINAPPKIKPFFAVLASFAPQAICTVPCKVSAWDIIIKIQPNTTAKPKPPIGLNQEKSTTGKLLLIFTRPPLLSTTEIVEYKIPK